MKKAERESKWRQENPRDQMLVVLGAIRGHLHNVEEGISDAVLLPQKLERLLNDIEGLAEEFMPKEWNDEQ